MGFLDNVLGSAVPGGNIAKPIGVALLALLAYKATGGGGLFGGAAAPAAPAGGEGPGYQPTPGYPPGQGYQPAPNNEPGYASGGQGYGEGPDYPLPPEHQMPSMVAGGLQGLVRQFQERGLGGVIDSWIGSGPNQPIRPEQLDHALGPETLDQLSRQTGMQRNDLVSQLAQALPQFIDRLTPQGRMPSESDISRWR